MKFDLSTKTEEVKWAIEGLIPSGQLCIILAQAGVGKSLVVEEIAICVAFGIPFLDMKTIDCNVLIIDQDTPTDVLHRRLKKFAKGMRTVQKHDLFVESMQGYSLDNKSLINKINEYPTAKLVVIDCLHSICGKLNPNYTSDMGVLAKFKQECLSDGRTILVNHHISEKRELPIDMLMTGDPHSFAMSSSAIIQQADTYYVIGAQAENGFANKLFLRIVPKRVAVSSKPLILQITRPDNESERMEYMGLYEPEYGEVELDILSLFRESPSDRTCKEVYESMGHKHGEKSIRIALIKLEKSGLITMSRHKSNLFKYRLP